MLTATAAAGTADTYFEKDHNDAKDVAVEAKLKKPREPISARRSVLSNSDENPYAIF